MGDIKNLIFSILVVAAFIFLGSKIKISKQEQGEDYDFKDKWDSVEEEFPVLSYLPKLTDKVDYWADGKENNSGLHAVSIGFKEVDDPEELADELADMLENAGYEMDKHSDQLHIRETSYYKENTLEVQYYDLEKEISGDRDVDSVRVTIEFFDYLYDDSYNVYVTVTPYG